MIRHLLATAALLAAVASPAAASPDAATWAYPADFVIDSGTVTTAGEGPALRLNALGSKVRSAHTPAFVEILKTWRASELVVCARAKAAQDGQVTRLILNAPRWDHPVVLTFGSDRFYTECGSVFNPIDRSGGTTVSVYVLGGQALVRYGLVYPGSYA